MRIEQINTDFLIFNSWKLVKLVAKKTLINEHQTHRHWQNRQ